MARDARSDIELVDDDEDAALASTRTAAGWLVSTRHDGEGGATVVAFDPDDPAARWETVLLEPDAAADTGFGTEGRASCEPFPAATPADERLLCHAEEHVTGGGPDGTTEAWSARRLVVLAAADGTPVADLTEAVPPWRYLTTAVLGDVAVLAGTDEQGTHLRALRPDGAVAWERTLPSEDASWVHLTVADGNVAVTADRHLHLLDPQGTTLTDTVLEPQSYVAGQHHGEVVVVQGLSEDLLLVGPDGTRTLPGRWVPLTADDGSGDGLALTVHQGKLRAWARDGSELWAGSSTVLDRGAFVLAGRVTFGARESVVTVDAATGREVWRVDDLAPASGLASDGRLLLTMAPSPASGALTDVVALRMDDGRTAWRTTLPRSVELWFTRLGVLTVVTGPDPDAGEPDGTALVLR